MSTASTASPSTSTSASTTTATPATQNSTIYVGTFVHCTTRQTLSYNHTTALGVSSNGIITFISPLADLTASSIANLAAIHGWQPSTYDVIRAPTTTKTGLKATAFFFPGFLDTHTHAPQYPNTGVFGSSTLLDWLNTYTFPLESSFSSLARARRVYSRVVARSLSHGTTCAAYYATNHVAATNLLADICLARGQRALVGRVCMDRFSPENYRDESPEAAIRDTKETMAHCAAIDPSGSIVRPVITPRFAPSCSDACLAALGALHKETGAAVQTHVSENNLEIALVAELFPAAANYTSVYDDAGLLSSKTILAHAVHLTPEERALISARKAKISHCPASNSSLTSGSCRVRVLWDEGIDVGLGTDMSGGYTPSILDMARQALLVSRHVAMAETEGEEKERAKLSVEEALWLATRGGASVVGLEGKVGGFEVGMEWDAQLIVMGEVEDEAEEVDTETETKPTTPQTDAIRAQAETTLASNAEKLDSAVDVLDAVVASAEQVNARISNTSPNSSKLNIAPKSEEERAATKAGLSEYSLNQVDGPIDLFGWESWPDRVAKWVYTGDDRNVYGVWVKGRLVHAKEGFCLA